MAVSGLKILFDENFSNGQVGFIATESRLAHFQHIVRMRWSGLADTDWIPRAVRAEFCIVTWDRNERTRGFTVNDLKAMRAKVILVGEFFDHMNRWQKAKWLVNHVEDVVTVCATMTPGSVCLMNRHGRTEPL
ncbi:MAG: hypothetical protein ABL949_13665 [Fimbriimonadaceae bacterium]